MLQWQKLTSDSFKLQIQIIQTDRGEMVIVPWEDAEPSEVVVTEEEHLPGVTFLLGSQILKSKMLDCQILLC